MNGKQFRYASLFFLLFSIHQVYAMEIEEISQSEDYLSQLRPELIQECFNQLIPLEIHWGSFHTESVYKKNVLSWACVNKHFHGMLPSLFIEWWYAKRKTYEFESEKLFFSIKINAHKWLEQRLQSLKCIKESLFIYDCYYYRHMPLTYAIVHMRSSIALLLLNTHDYKSRCWIFADTDTHNRFFYNALISSFKGEKLELAIDNDTIFQWAVRHNYVYVILYLLKSGLYNSLAEKLYLVENLENKSLTYLASHGISFTVKDDKGDDLLLQFIKKQELTEASKIDIEQSTLKKISRFFYLQKIDLWPSFWYLINKFIQPLELKKTKQCTLNWYGKAAIALIKSQEISFSSFYKNPFYNFITTDFLCDPSITLALNPIKNYTSFNKRSINVHGLPLCCDKSR